MFKVIMMAIFYGIIKAALWVWQKKWWIVSLAALWLLWRHHFFTTLTPWFSKVLQLPGDTVTLIVFAVIGGAVIGSIFTGIIMVGMRKDKTEETYERW